MKKFIIAFLVLLESVNAGKCQDAIGVWVQIHDYRQDWKSTTNFTQGFLRIDERNGKYKIWVLEGDWAYILEFSAAKDLADGCLFVKPTTKTKVQQNKAFLYQSSINGLYYIDIYPKSVDSSGFFRATERLHGIPGNLYKIEKDIPGSLW